MLPDPMGQGPEEREPTDVQPVAALPMAAFPQEGGLGFRVKVFTTTLNQPLRENESLPGHITNHSTLVSATDAGGIYLC